MRKPRDVFLYHSACNHSDGLTFDVIVERIAELDTSKRSVVVRGVRSVLCIESTDDFWILSLQNLSNDDLPKVANDDDGGDEQNLDVPQGKAMSYKNCFVFNRKTNVLGMAKISMCPRVARLAAVINSIIRQEYEELGVPEDTKVRFPQIFEKGLAERLSSAKTITMAQISMKDYYGDNVKEKDFGAYKDYMGGLNYSKVTKLHGRNGANIKEVVQFIIDDVVQCNDIVNDFEISMKVDGERINFSQYFKRYNVSVLMDENNHKYVDYVDLIREVASIVGAYGV